MLTPPLHYSIVACPLTPSSNADEVLYRGSIPVRRNIAFLDRLRVRTLLYLRKKELGQDDPMSVWAALRGVDLRWVKAERMSEEKLGMGKSEVGEVMRTILDRSAYPLYIADVDGISHTMLVVACLRKMQGWHIDSIIGEMCRFEPEYEDYSLVPFITAYLTGPDASFVLPQPPFPAWLWPTSTPLTLSRTFTRERATSSSANTSSILPFPHPLTARKHPTMRLSFPVPPAPALNTPLSPTATNQNPLSRTNTRIDWTDQENRPAPAIPSSAGLAPSGVSGVASLLPGQNDSDETATGVSMPMGSRGGSANAPSSLSNSPEKHMLSRQLTMESAQEMESPEAGEDMELEDEYDDFDEDDDDDEEEDDDEDDDVQPTSQYISALDLAGY